MSSAVRPESDRNRQNKKEKAAAENKPQAALMCRWRGVLTFLWGRREARRQHLGRNLPWGRSRANLRCFVNKPERPDWYRL